ncbi:MAG: roadblock/LC7 domain-containing protein [Candidatus Ranarchaeia archaeon]
MGLLEQIAQHLGNIKTIPGVENVVLTQKDGVPIKSVGVWFSKDDIFRVCSATSAIYSVAQRLHPTLDHVLLEGEGAKIFIAPIDTPSDYYMAVTTQSRINLGHVFMRMSQSVKAIRVLLPSQKEDVVAPLRSFTDDDLERIRRAFQVRPELETSQQITSVNLQITPSLTSSIDQTIQNFVKMLPGILSSAVILKGGYLLTNFNAPSEKYAAMVFSLYDTAKRLAWLIKNIYLSQVLCMSGHINHLIYEMDNALFSTNIDQNKTRLGMLRLLVGSVLKELEKTMREANANERPSFKFDAPLAFNQIRGTML